jgi:hypothetical protein
MKSFPVRLDAQVPEAVQLHALADRIRSMVDLVVCDKRQ